MALKFVDLKMNTYWHDLKPIFLDIWILALADLQTPHILVSYKDLWFYSKYELVITILHDILKKDL